jgi:hypothetical protein
MAYARWPGSGLRTGRKTRRPSWRQPVTARLEFTADGDAAGDPVADGLEVTTVVDGPGVPFDDDERELDVDDARELEPEPEPVPPEPALPEDDAAEPGVDVGATDEVVYEVPLAE